MDDDGVRGVRPYLLYGPAEMHRRPAQNAEVSRRGEFDELAGLVRTLLDLRA